MTARTVSGSSIQLRDIQGFHIGGEVVRSSGLPSRSIPTIRGNPDRLVDPNGDYAVGQLYVQGFLLETPKAPCPLQLWHGGGLTGVCWETTPDGRSGWLNYFLRHGHDTLVIDASERGRASWAPYPTINADAPWHRTLDMAWTMFRFGPEGSYSSDPARRKTYPGQQFPIEAADQFLKQFVARWGSRQSDAWALAAYRALLHHTGRSAIIAHSQGGLFALDLAVAQADLFSALVLLEPVLPPESDYDLSALRSVPILIIAGDNLARRGALDAFTTKLQGEGVDAQFIHLPKLGIMGNSHMLMMDRNSEAIAGMVEEWLGNHTMRPLCDEPAAIDNPPTITAC